MKKGSIQLTGVQALRGIAFMGVFLSHTGLKWFGAAGHWAVSIFLVLSGFMMVYSYWNTDKIKSVSIITLAAFAWNKIKKLYPLHICTMIAMLVPALVGIKTSIDIIAAKILTNVLILQEWFPIKNGSINGVAWYLSTAIFCYFIFPLILNWLKKITNRNIVFGIMLSALIAQFFLSYLFSFLAETKCDSEWIRKDLAEWLIYFFPPMRCLDFFVGCCTGYLYMTSIKNSRNSKFLLVIILCEIVVSNIVCVLYETNKMADVGEVNGSVLWWTYSIPFTFSSCGLIYLLVKNETILPHFFVNQGTLLLGKISGSAFLIHYVVFQYLKSFMCQFISIAFYEQYGAILKLTVGFLLTIAATWGWNKLSALIISRQLK